MSGRGGGGGCCVRSSSGREKAVDRAWLGTIELI